MDIGLCGNQLTCLFCFGEECAGQLVGAFGSERLNQALDLVVVELGLVVVELGLSLLVHSLIIGSAGSEVNRSSGGLVGEHADASSALGDVRVPK